MDIDLAVKRGFLNLSEEECKKLVRDIYDLENPENRLTKAVQLLSTFVPQKRMPYVLNLASVILEANREIQEVEGEFS